MKRAVHDTGAGLIFTESAQGVNQIVVRSKDSIEVSKQAWAELKDKVKTHEVDFATVKRKHGKEELK